MAERRPRGARREDWPNQGARAASGRTGAGRRPQGSAGPLARSRREPSGQPLPAGQLPSSEGSTVPRPVAAASRDSPSGEMAPPAPRADWCASSWAVARRRRSALRRRGWPGDRSPQAGQAFDQTVGRRGCFELLPPCWPGRLRAHLFGADQQQVEITGSTGRRQSPARIARSRANDPGRRPGPVLSTARRLAAEASSPALPVGLVRELAADDRGRKQRDSVCHVSRGTSGPSRAVIPTHRLVVSPTLRSCVRAGAGFATRTRPPTLDLDASGVS